MKNIIKQSAAALIIAAISFTGCGEDPAELEQPGIVIDPEVALERTADADATTAGSVRFTTSAEWSSAIAPDTVTWLRIDPAEGGAAGTYTVNFVLTPNTAEDSRTATVTITAGGMSAKIDVTQRGTAAVPETPAERKITFRVYGCEEQYAIGNGKEPHFLLGGVTVNVYKGTELVASPKTNSEGIAEVTLTDGVYAYVAVNDSAVPWSNILRRPDAEPTVAGRVIIGIYNADRPYYIPEDFPNGGIPGALKYRDINGDGTIDAQDYAAQVELPVTKDAEVDVYVAPWDFMPVFPWFHGAYGRIMNASAYRSLVSNAYRIDASLTQEYRTANDLIADYQLNSGNGNLSLLWSHAYDMILYANTVLDLLPAVTGTGETDGANEAYARYYRACAYYTLLNYFGGVPVTSLTSQQISVAAGVGVSLSVSEPRSSEAEVEDQIIADCNFVAVQVSWYGNYMGNSSTALQLKARVLMRRGQHSAAIAVLREIMDAGRYSLSSYWGRDGIGVGMDNLSLPTAMYKGKNPDFPNEWTPVYPVRYAETLLLYAEASLATGDIMAAAQVANQFAAAMYESPVFPDAGGATQEAVSAEITRLWNTQLNMEAHTFARLKRTGAFPGALAAYGAQEHHKVMPIPAGEILRNPNLVQNAGYE